jgi:hypothetical protein
MATNESPTIIDLVEGLPRLRVYDEELSNFEEKQFVSSIRLAEKNTYLGIEVETENVTYWDDHYSPYWRMVEDGSLRNNGREFVTVPIKAYRVENALTTLFKNQLNKDIDFSERTSIHVHMNVRTLTLAQLQAMILLYLVFEKALFRYVNPERYTNIFCVPLNETTFAQKLKDLFHQNTLNLSWSKYTALNLCPIFEKGTIEFRHLHGTKDVEEIVNWINLLLCLKKMALMKSPEYIWEKVKNLNTTSQYHEFANEVFGHWISQLEEKNLIQDMSSCITYVKSRCFDNPWVEALYTNPCHDSPLFKFTAKGIYSKKPTATFLEEDTLEVAPQEAWPSELTVPSPAVARQFNEPSLAATTFTSQMRPTTQIWGLPDERIQETIIEIRRELEGTTTGRIQNNRGFTTT